MIMVMFQRIWLKLNENQNLNQIWTEGYKPELWQKALKACEDFFTANAANGNYFALIQPTGNTQQDYCNAYRAAYWFRGNSEKIIEVHAGPGNNGGDALAVARMLAEQAYDVSVYLFNIILRIQRRRNCSFFLYRSNFWKCIRIAFRIRSFFCFRNRNGFMFLWCN